VPRECYIDAKSIVRLHCAGGSYFDCVEVLQVRYDRNKMVYKHHTEKVMQLKSATETYDSLGKYRHDATLLFSGTWRPVEEIPSSHYLCLL